MYWERKHPFAGGRERPVPGLQRRGGGRRHLEQGSRNDPTYYYDAIGREIKLNPRPDLGYISFPTPSR